MKRIILSAVLLAAACVCGLVATSSGAALFAAGLVVVGVAVVRPQPVIVLVIVVALFPAVPLSVASGLMLAVSGGVALRYLNRINQSGVMLGLLVVTLVVTAAINPTPYVVGEDTARSHLIASIVPMVLALAIGLARTPARLLRAGLAIGGGFASGWVLVVGQEAAGRFRTEELGENTVGYVGALTVVAAVACRTSTGRNLWLMVAALGLAPMVLSQSRGALVAALAGVLALWALRLGGPGRLLTLVFAPILVFLGLPLLGNVFNIYFSRRGVGTLDSNTRVDLIRLSFEAMKEHPLTGIGWRAFPDLTLEQLGRATNAHNEFLRVGAEAGLIALFMLAALVWLALRRRALTVDKAILLTGLVSFGLSNTMSTPSIALFVWVGLAACLWTSRRMEPLHHAVVVPSGGRLDQRPESGRAQLKPHV